MKIKYLLSLICISLFNINSGIAVEKPVIWGKISPYEINLSEYKGDTTYSGLVLCDYGTIEVSNRTFYTRHKRIKILHTTQNNTFEINIPFTSSQNYDDVLNIKAQVYRPQPDGKMVQFKYTEKDFSTIHLSKNARLKHLALTQLKNGDIIEYTYNIASLDFINLDTWFFQDTIPVLWSEIQLTFPKPFTYLVTYQEKDILSLEEENAFAENLSWMYTTNINKRKISLYKRNNILYETSDNKFRVYALNDMKKRIVLKNLNPISNPIAGGIQLKLHLFESSGYLPWIYRPLLINAIQENKELDYYKHWEPREFVGYVHYQLETWDEFNTKLVNNSNFGLSKYANPSIKQNLESITDLSEKQKIEKIFTFVKDSIKWNKEYRYVPQQNFEKVWKSGMANSAELNLFLISLLKATGLEVKPVLIRTQNLGLPQTVYPAHNQFNHVIAMVKLNNEVILLDATGAKNYLNLPEKDLHTKGWIVDKTNYGWLNIALEFKAEKETPWPQPLNEQDI